MTNKPAIPDEDVVSQVSKHILEMADTSRQQVIFHANRELIILYYNVGKYLTDVSVKYNWGQNYIDRVAEIIADENPSIKKIYDEFFGEPNSHKAHELLHTHYIPRPKFK